MTWHASQEGASAAKDMGPSSFITTVRLPLMVQHYRGLFCQARGSSQPRHRARKSRSVRVSPSSCRSEAQRLTMIPERSPERNGGRVHYICAYRYPGKIGLSRAGARAAERPAARFAATLVDGRFSSSRQLSPIADRIEDGRPSDAAIWGRASRRRLSSPRPCRRCRSRGRRRSARSAGRRPLPS
jgi:hypothetical protein